MLKAILALGSAAIAAPLLASPAMLHLAGLSDSETTIQYGDISQTVRGPGDLFIVKERDNQW